MSTGEGLGAAPPGPGPDIVLGARIRAEAVRWTHRPQVHGRHRARPAGHAPTELRRVELPGAAAPGAASAGLRIDARLELELSDVPSPDGGSA